MNASLSSNMSTFASPSPFSRRATCSLQILKYKDSIKDFKQVVKLDPKNDLAKSQLAETQKLLRKIEFEKVNITCDRLQIFTCT